MLSLRVEGRGRRLSRGEAAACRGARPLLVEGRGRCVSRGEAQLPPFTESSSQRAQLVWTLHHTLTCPSVRAARRARGVGYRGWPLRVLSWDALRVCGQLKATVTEAHH